MYSTVVLACVVGLASAFSYTVVAGKDEVTGLPGVGFSPSRVVTRETNDLIFFQMMQGQHRIVTVNPISPCLNNGTYDSQVQTVANDTVWSGSSLPSFTVANASYTYYFADIAAHNCEKGAIFCVNVDQETCNTVRAAALAIGAANGIPVSVRTNTPVQTTTSTSQTGTASTSSETTQPVTNRAGGEGAAEKLSAQLGVAASLLLTVLAVMASL